jgi:hypothetical protein
MEESRKNTEAAIETQLDKIKTDFEARTREAESARAEVQAYVDEKKGETEAKIKEWKTNRELGKLEKRADNAEEYAAYCILVAMAAVDEAEVAILEAVVARRESDEAQLAAV